MALSDLPSPIQAGRVLGGRYRLSQHIARGGMAEVWEGYDEVLSRPVAVKVLQPHLAEDGIFLERFRREAVTAANLVHPYIVSTFDTGVDDGTAYIVMELVRGRTLRQLMNERRRLEPWLAAAIARQIADALAHAHQAGLIHRDVKPANVLLTDDEWGGLRVKVTDFGIAKAGSGLGRDLTRTGTVLGTPKYLSPEQIKGEEPDARADLYSLGVLLFEMLVGEPPFVGNTDMATALSHMHDKAPRVSSRVKSVPPALDRLVNELLIKDPQRRVPSAAALRERLDSLALVPPINERRGPSSPGFRSPSGRRRNRSKRAGVLSVVPDITRSGSTGTSTTAGAPGAVTAAIGTHPNGSAVLREPTRQQTQPDHRAESRPHATDFFEAPPPAPRRSLTKRARAPGFLVGALVAVGVVLAAVLVSATGSGKKSPQSAAGGPVAAIQIANVTPFMADDRNPDDVGDMPHLFDGNPATFWNTDLYNTPNFGNLYPGLGLDIQITGPEKLHHLVVTSASQGWSAQTSVSATPITTGQNVSVWGQPTDTKTSINGSATFNLSGHRDQWVLLWLTNLGQPNPSGLYQVRINEISVN